MKTERTTRKAREIAWGKATALFESITNRFVVWWGSGYTPLDMRTKQLLYGKSFRVWLERIFVAGAPPEIALWWGVRFMFRYYRRFLAPRDLQAAITRFMARRRRINPKASFDDVILGVIVFAHTKSPNSKTSVARICNELGLPVFDAERNAEALHVARVLSKLLALTE